MTDDDDDDDDDDVDDEFILPIIESTHTHSSLILLFKQTFMNASHLLTFGN